MKPIVRIPNQVLTQKAVPVTRFDKKLKNLIEDMKDTLIRTTNPRGVGLAAPQVGVGTQIFIARESTKVPIRIFINPKILTKSNPSAGDTHDDKKLEGCLSIPKIWGNLKRPSTVTVRYQDETGKEHTETVSGFLATIIQHEVDHLGGILFTQRVLEQKGQLYQTVRDTSGKETLEEFELA